MTSSSSSAAAAGLSGSGDMAAYAEAMHSILSGEPCRGLVTEPTRLLPHVFIGSQSNAEDLTTMRRLGISHVLNCAGYKGPRPSPHASPYDGLGIEYYEFKAEDSDRYDITRHFGEAFRFLDSAKRHGGVVLVHCALGINRSAAVCVGYMMVDRRLSLLDATRIIKARRRIVLANKSFQRQLVGFARTRGLLGELPQSQGEDGVVNSDDDDGARRLRLNDGGTLNGLHVDLAGSSAHRIDPLSSYKSRWRGDWSPRSGSGWSSAYSSSAVAGRSNHVSSSPASRYNDYVTNFSSTTARSRETDDVTRRPASYVSPRQYRATKSATNLLPAASSGHVTRAPARPSLHSRSSSASRFSFGFL